MIARKNFIVFISITLVTVLAIVAYAYYKSSFTNQDKPKSIQNQSFLPTKEDEYINDDISTAKLDVVASDLNIPWEIAFLPSGDMLVTQRSGELLKIGKETKIIQTIQGVNHQGEGGLLGLALHPDYSQNNLLFLYLTSRQDGEIVNRVESYQFINDTLEDRKVIIDGIKGASNHDGGRIAFGPDGYLYITTGDAEDPDSAQDINSLNGKILRVTEDGRIPSDNPFGNAVYSYGHRNPQGFAWDNLGNLWASEHGPSGLASGFDEINLIKAGSNYGWPLVTGNTSQEGIELPVIHSGSTDTWAPSGMSHNSGILYFSGLRGEALYKAEINEDGSLSLTEHFKGKFGRIRAVVMGIDGNLYFTTSNTDGRGSPQNGDDKIIRVNLNN